MVVVSVLLHEVFGRNDHREDAPHFNSIILICVGVKSNLHNHKFGQNSLDRIVVRCLLGEPCPKYRKSSKYIWQQFQVALKIKIRFLMAMNRRFFCPLSTLFVPLTYVQFWSFLWKNRIFEKNYRHWRANGKWLISLRHLDPIETSIPQSYKPPSDHRDTVSHLISLSVAMIFLKNSIFSQKWPELVIGEQDE